MTTFLQNVVAGMETGSLYALAALGVVIIFRVSSVTNFAQGEMSMFSAFTAWTIWSNLREAGFPYPYPVAFIATIIFAICFGYVVERFFIRPASKGSMVGKMIVTLGLIMIVNGSAGAIFGTDSHYMQRAIAGNMNIGGVLIRPHSIFVISVALIFMTILFFMIKKNYVWDCYKGYSSK